MKGFLYIFTGISIGVACSVYADDFYGIHNEDIFLSTGIVKNYGTLNGAIYVNDYANVWFQNYGQVNASFNYGTGAILLQQVTSADNLHKIDNLFGHTVQVSNAHDISMSELAYTAENAVQIKLEDSSVVVDANFQDFTVPIKVVGNSVALYISGNPENWLDNDIPLLSNISGQTPFIQVINDNPLYAVQSNLNAGTLYVKSVRQTNYSAVTPNQSLGEYLEQLQLTNPDNQLIQNLNGAVNMEQMNSILAASPRTNPIKLMDAVKTIDSVSIANLRYTSDFGILVRPDYVLSRDFSYYDMRFGLGGNITENLTGVVGLSAGRISYSDKYEDTTGVLYSGNVGLHYNADDYFINLLGAFSYAKFYDIDVFSGGRSVKNPHGQDGNILLDSGMRLNIVDDLEVSPFVGVRFNRVSLLNDADTAVSGRLGLNLTSKTQFDENLYSVGLRALAESNNTFYCGVYTDVFSTADSISGGIGFGVLYDDMGWTYQITLNTKFLF